MALVRWQLTDPQTAEVFTLSVNPNAGGSEEITRTIDSTPTTAGGQTHMEGRPKVNPTEVSGWVEDQGLYDAFRYWLSKPYPVALADDLGRQATIVLAEFRPVKQALRHRSWRHAYTLRYYTISETDPA